MFRVSESILGIIQIWPGIAITIYNYLLASKTITVLRKSRQRKLKESFKVVRTPSCLFAKGAKKKRLICSRRGGVPGEL